MRSKNKPSSIELARMALESQKPKDLSSRIPRNVGLSGRFLRKTRPAEQASGAHTMPRNDSLERVVRGQQTASIASLPLQRLPSPSMNSPHARRNESSAGRNVFMTSKDIVSTLDSVRESGARGPRKSELPALETESKER